MAVMIVIHWLEIIIIVVDTDYCIIDEGGQWCWLTIDIVDELIIFIQ